MYWTCMSPVTVDCSLGFADCSLFSTDAEIMFKCSQNIDTYVHSIIGPSPNDYDTKWAIIDVSSSWMSLFIMLFIIPSIMAREPYN